MTTKTTAFNNTNIKAILADAQAALDAVAEKHGLTLERTNCRYQRDQLPVAFRFITVELDPNGNAMDSRAKDFLKYASVYGLSESDFLAEFDSNGNRFRITGFKPRAVKYPVLAENVRTGKTYKFTAETVKAALARSRAA